MKKKIIGAFCVLALCLVLLPATAHAAEHEHPVCGAACDGDCGGGHSSATWQPFSTEAWNDMENGKEYWFYLTKDVTVTDILRIGNNTTVHLCLNGHILDGSQSQSGIIFYVGSLNPYLTSGNLTLCDCQTTEHTGHIDNETHLWTRGAGSDADTPCNLTGGVITGAKAHCVYVHSGTLTMYGGNLAGNTAINGGAISLGLKNDAFFTMYGGIITGNTATNGGGIEATGTVNINGGSISNNSATSGGGVYVSGGSCNISSGVNSTTSISNNSATYGGGVYVSGGTCNINSGSSISGNTATDGGGVYVGGGSCDIISGVNSTTSISNNSATNGGGVYVNRGMCTLACSISNNSATSNGGGVYVALGNCNISSYTSDISGNSATYGGGVYVSEGSCDITGSSSISNNSAIIGGGVFIKGGGSTFNMSNNASISSNTAVVDTNPSQTGAGGGVFVESGGTFNMSGGSISNNSATRGGGVFLNADGSTFNMSDGSISSNTAGNGGGVYIENTSVLKMSGGSISNNSANLGSGVYAFHDSIQLNLSGASVIDGVIHSREGRNLITINGELTGDTKFQLNNVSSGTFTSGWKEKMGEADPADYFSLSKTGYHVGLGNDGEAAVFANTYTVTFNSNNGVGSMAEMTFTYDGEEKALTTNSFTRTGYTFDGWSDGNGKTYTDGQEVKNLTAENGGIVTLTAQWTPNSYTVHFECNGGDNGSMSDQRFTYDAVQSLAPNGFTKTGHSFDGWSTTPSGSVMYTDKQEIKNLTAENGGTITLYAQWTVNTYTVTLHPNEGEIDGSTPGSDGNYVIQYTYGIGAALPTEKEIARSGYRFGGWYDNEKLEGKPVTEITATDVGNKTYWARWDYISGTPTYSVILPDNVTGGEVTANKRYAEKGETFRFTVKAYEGYALSALTVTDSKGSELPLTDEGSGVWSFKMPASKVTVEAVFAPVTLPFTDVPENAWYYDAVWYTYTHGLMNGTSATTFAPGGTTSRAMIVTILWRQAGSPVVNYAMHFDDVSQGQWYSEAIRWAASEGIAGGYGNGSFGTNDPITREQFAAMLYRYAQKQGYDVSVGEDTNILSYTDVSEVSEYAIPALQWACGAGVIQGSGANLNPKDGATRAEAATMLMRFCIYYADAE